MVKTIEETIYLERKIFIQVYLHSNNIVFVVGFFSILERETLRKSRTQQREREREREREKWDHLGVISANEIFSHV